MQTENVKIIYGTPLFRCGVPGSNKASLLHKPSSPPHQEQHLWPLQKKGKVMYSAGVPAMTSSNAGVARLRSEQPSDLLPENYDPSILDVCSGRGKRNWNHAGNVAFRNLIQSQVDAYMAAKSKNDKTAIVLMILDEMRNKGYNFLKINKEGRWYDMGDAQARDKIGHGLRDQVTAINRQNRESEQKGGQHVRLPSITMSDSGNEAEHRKNAVKTAHVFEKFARRPSWIAGESSSSNEMVEGMPTPQGFDMERRRSSWDFLDNFDYYIDNGIDPMQSNNSVIDMSAARVSDDISDRMDVSPSDLMKDSLMSFDPRVSGASSVFMSSARAGSARESTSIRAPGGNGRDNSMRMSGGSTLRQATNSLRVSDMSDMTGLLDFSNSESV